MPAAEGGSSPPQQPPLEEQFCSNHTNDGQRHWLFDRSSQIGKQSAWPTWAAVQQDLGKLAKSAPFFLELFAGKAGITEAVHLQGIPVLPPVDIEPCDLNPSPLDLVDVQVWMLIMDIIGRGWVFFLHCGTPCNTFTSARKDDGGPPPLRSLEAPMGLPDLRSADEPLVFLGNLFLERSCEACYVVFLFGGDFTIENPLLSLIWHTHILQALVHDTRALSLDLDQCAFGTPWVKPTRLLSSTELLDDVAVRCPRNHVHAKLKGKVWDPQRQRMVFRTKLAQVYPWALCATIAQAVALVFADPLHHLLPSFALALPAQERKRALGSGKLWSGHRQADTARKALAAGYQLKRGAAKPLLEIEMEPGEAIRWSLMVPHPFTQAAQLDSDLVATIKKVAADPTTTILVRQQALQHWQDQAERLLPVSLAMIARRPDPALRRLLLGTDDPSQATLGSVCHVALYDAMLRSCNSVDTSLPTLLLEGFPIVGPIQCSGRWPPYEKPQKELPVQAALDRAWAIREKIVNRVRGVPVTDNLKKIWDATLEDVEEGSCLGPFKTQSEVGSVLKQEDWIPTQRFEVVQKNKVRGCDSATTNMINQVTVITEKLQLPSTDTNVAALRQLKTVSTGLELKGWALDERKAYRQIALRPDHRKFSVICLKNPESGHPEFFIMVGHSFGLVSAVYNYNRRSAAINEILVKLFGLVAFSFYDDKYGFEPSSTAANARLVAESVHFWLGARFDQKKLQLSDAPTILGVTYNLKDMQLEIKADRKKELVDEIDSVLASNLLDPGSAGKLKGKLMFGASQLWGKVGRAFLRPISVLEDTCFIRICSRNRSGRSP